MLVYPFFSLYGAGPCLAWMFCPLTTLPAIAATTTAPAPNTFISIRPPVRCATKSPSVGV